MLAAHSFYFVLYQSNVGCLWHNRMHESFKLTTKSILLKLPRMFGSSSFLLKLCCLFCSFLVYVYKANINLYITHWCQMNMEAAPRKQRIRMIGNVKIVKHYCTALNGTVWYTETRKHHILGSLMCKTKCIQCISFLVNSQYDFLQKIGTQ